MNSLFNTSGSVDRLEPTMDAHNQGFEICNLGTSSERTCYEDPGIAGPSGARNHARPGNQAILEFFEQYPTSSILSIVKTSQWLNSKFAFMDRSNDLFRNCCDIFQRRICNYTINQFINLYNKGYPLFSALSGNIDDEYYSRAEPIDKLLTFLEFQCDNIDNIREFLYIIYLHINKQSGKRNCISIIGPPSSGKTYFVNIISSFLISKGQIRNVNKFNNFPLNDCVDKRVLIWDEPNYERSALEQIKLLFSGDKCRANVKYENQVQIDKTPIYVNSNCDMIPQNDEFTCRMFRFYWKPFLEPSKVVKQIYPLALYDIFVKFGIINNTMYTI